MSRKTLLSAGCSLVYGAELSDSPGYNGENKPSLKTWPALYATFKGYDYKTCSRCGISNQGIARYVIDAVESISPDVVIVQWTFFDRYEIRLNNPNLSSNQSYYYVLSSFMSNDLRYSDVKINSIKEDLHPTIKNISTMWYRHIDSDESGYFNYLKNKIDLANYLRWKKIPFVFANSQSKLIDVEKTTTDGSLLTLINLDKTIPEIDFEGHGFYNWAKIKQYTFGVNHPLDQAHQEAFNILSYKIDQSLL
jgi:hypothetical protein